MYVPLWNKSNASFLEGASFPEELVAQASFLGLPAMALTDRNGFYGAVRAHVEAKKRGVRLLLGVELSMHVASASLSKEPGKLYGASWEEAPAYQPVVLFPQSKRGYQALCRLLTTLHASDAPLPLIKNCPQTNTAVSTEDPPGAAETTRALHLEDTEEIMALCPTPDVATALFHGRRFSCRRPSQSDGSLGSHHAAHVDLPPGCLPLSRRAGQASRRAGQASRTAGQASPTRKAGLLAGAQNTHGAPCCDEGHGREGGRWRGPIGLLYVHEYDARTAQRFSMLDETARATGLPGFAAVEVLYHVRSRGCLQDALRSIHHGCFLGDAGHRLRQNHEHALPSEEDIRQRFSGRAHLLTHTQTLLEMCKFSLDDLSYRYPLETEPGREGSVLRQHVYAGAQSRWGQNATRMHAKIEHELEIIESLGYEGYFLTMHDIVRFCRSKGILCQGRGSAANSVVCFCLGITAIDPTEIDLLFERFLSRERAEPPDIDLDIAHQRREEVIRYVYESYGMRRAAMVATVIRYRPRLAVRDVGKALGISAWDCAVVSQSLDRYGHDIHDDAFVRCSLAQDSRTLRLWKLLSRQLLRFPRHLGTHPGGFLLGQEPVDELVPVQPASMPGRTIIQWDKNDIESMGLFKVDLLGLGALTCIDACLRMLPEVGCHDVQSMHQVPREDAATYDMISAGDTVGVFQIESRAQMSMLPRLQPRTFYDLVIEVAIVRPGPIQGDMVHPYLRRRQGKEPVLYPHPSLEKILGKTKGVPIFQEQVMRLAVQAAGYTPGEADQLRRDMAAWHSSTQIEAHHERLTSRMVANGIAADFAERIFSQIRGFGEYGFPESHAASFAFLAYVTAWFKCHHPDVFLCAMLNAQPMGFYGAATLIEDARRHGVQTWPVDVRCSEWANALQSSDAGERGVRLGLCNVPDLREEDAHKLREARDAPTFFALIRAAHLGKHVWMRLAEAGALVHVGIPRDALLWEIPGLHACQDDTLPCASNPSSSPQRHSALTPIEELLWDHQSMGLSTRGHPMLAMRPCFRSYPRAVDLSAVKHRTHVSYVGMVICRQKPATASGVCFMTLEDETGFVNLVIWKHVFARYKHLARTTWLLGVSGQLQVADGNVRHLIASSLWHPARGAPASVSLRHRSRDFH